MPTKSNLPAAPGADQVETLPYEKLSINDHDNTFSIVNLVPSWLANAIEAVPQDVLDMDVDSLRAVAKPSSVEERLRLSFWNEYTRTIHRQTTAPLNLTNICGGVCSQRAFRKLAETSKFKLAYILTPPPILDLALEEIIQLGFEEMKMIMQLPIVTNGRVDARLAQVKYKIFTDVATKRYGHKSTLHIKSSSTHAHAHLHAQVPQEPPEAQPLTSVDVESAIAHELNPPAEELPIIETIGATVSEPDDE